MTAAQQELFPADRQVLPDPARAEAQVHRGAGDTEQAAAQRVALKAGTIRAKLLQRLVECSTAGVTGSEATAWLRIDGRRVKETSVRPRFPELVRDGWAVDSGQRRRAGVDGPAEIAYAVTDTGAAVFRAWQSDAAAVR